MKYYFTKKPFAELNGSGKHNNWALSTNTGKNLLAPSSKAKDNLQFLTFFINIIKAVNDQAALLRASIASAGNDHRLGANEAPPAIISVFIGEQLSRVLDELEKYANVIVDKEDNSSLDLGIDKLPEISLDNTDRNRTSPFAFTGNRFEFRAVGSFANNAQPMTILNIAVANQLKHFKVEVDKKIKEGDEKEVAIIDVLRRYVKESKNVRFEGNGYSEEWAAEAKKRGLPNVKSTPMALDAYISEQSLKLFADYGVMSKTETMARHEIMLENYTMKIQIESRIIGDLAFNHIVPTAISYQNKLIQNVKGLKDIDLGGESGEVIETIKRISKYVHHIKRLVLAMIEQKKVSNKYESPREQAISYCDDIKEKYFDEIRRYVDKLELIVDDEDWPLPKYRELLFLR